MYDVIADLCSAGLALAALGLHAVQHRGQESAGIVAFDGQHFNAHRDLGLVGDIFSSEGVMSRLAGHAAIGHNRYSTTGETALRNVQPLFADLSCGGFALAHRSEEHTSELQSLMRISYAVFCLKNKKNKITKQKQYYT